jgi:hypothetical protein
MRLIEIPELLKQHWLGGRVATWYWPFLRIPVTYVAVAILFNGLLLQLRAFVPTGVDLET